MHHSIDVDIATPKDSSALAGIMIAAWRSGFQNILPSDTIERYTNFENCQAMFTQILTSGNGIMYLAELDGRPAGLLYWLTEQEDARIEALLTVPEAWGTGLAAALIMRMLTDIPVFHTIHVWPFAENHRARRFYEKHGFVPSGNYRQGDTTELEYIRKP